ncbi:MAG: GIY-YIG nuclease family protein [Gammaproteobacteria bacterium]|nr:GIY-YIG nuclease family protein [Gammaproteobacteria bacterium]
MAELSAPCSYQLHISIEPRIRLTVGRLGTFTFPPGRYIYTGSARRNLEARIQRHLRHTKRLHWHIDYLLERPEVEVLGVSRSIRPECELNLSVCGNIVVPGFGASDCRSGCGSHLKYTK